MHSRVIEGSVRRIWGTVAAAVLLLGACTDKEPEVGFEGLPEASASPSPAATPSASVEAASDDIDVTTTPEEITPEWVTAVVNTILAEYGETEAAILAQPESNSFKLEKDVEADLEALFDGEYLSRRKQALADAATNAEGYRDKLLPPNEFRGLRFFAETVPHHQQHCIIAVGRVSRELTIPNGGLVEELSAVSLTPASEYDSQEVNPTQWVILDELANIGADGTPNADSYMLDATLDDYEGALDHTCERDAE